MRRTTSRALAALGIGALAALAPAVTARAGTCPPTTVAILPSPAFEVHTARYDTTADTGGMQFQISLDLAAGTQEARITSNATGRIEIDASDVFLLQGPFTGPREIDAVLEVTAVRFDACGLQCAWAMTRLDFRDEATGRTEHHQADTRQAAGVYHFEMPLTITPTFDVPFALSTILELQVSGLGANLYGRADLGTRLRFDRLPSGARVTSCRGFVNGTVPVRASSWGRIKATYR